MRRILVGLLVLFVGVASAKATTMQVILKDANASNVTPGSTHTIQIWVKGGYDGSTALGIAGAEFELIGQGPGAAYTGTASFKTSGTKNPIALLGYTTQTPAALDGATSTSTYVPQPVLNSQPDGNNDAIGLAFFATPGAVTIDPSNAGWAGVVGSPGGAAGSGLPTDAQGFVEIATENWVFNKRRPLASTSTVLRHSPGIRLQSMQRMEPTTRAA